MYTTIALILFSLLNIVLWSKATIAISKNRNQKAAIVVSLTLVALGLYVTTAVIINAQAIAEVLP